MPTQDLILLYDVGHLRREILTRLNDFLVWVRTDRVRNLLGSVTLQHLRNQEQQISTRLDGDFYMVVLGDFKRGKSTLINALLGQYVVTTNVTPETVTINHIHYGPALNLSACLEEGGRAMLEPEDLRAERLQTLLTNLPGKVSHLRIEAPVEWLKDITIVDTPGTGDVLKSFDEEVQQFLSQADAVIFVISVLSPLSETEQSFLRLSILPQDFPKLFFLLNMMDFVHTDQEEEKVLNSVRDKIGSLFPRARVFGISALDEWCRIQSQPRPAPDRASILESRFQNFRACLDESILLNRDLIQLDRSAERMGQMLVEFESGIAVLRNAMQLDQIGLETAIARCESSTSDLHANVDRRQQEIRQTIKKMSEQACMWMDEFIDRFENEAIKNLSKYRLEEIERYYQLFLTDAVRQAMHLCFSVHQSAILRALQEIQVEINQDVQRTIVPSLDKLQIDRAVAQAVFGDSPWTVLQTFNVYIEKSGFGNLYRFVLNRVSKDVAVSKQVLNFQQRLQQVLPELRQTITDKIGTFYGGIATEVEQQITNIFQKNIEVSLAALRQAKEMAAAGEQRSANANEVFGELQVLISETRSFLNVFQQKIWGQNLQDDALSG